MNKKKSVLFVCTGNICRSPTAEALFRHAVREAGLDAHFIHDSAGVASGAVGSPPDARSQKVLAASGIDMSDLRARNIRQSDYYDFDLILAMDKYHLTELRNRAPKDATAKIALYLPHAHGSGEGEVPDPYFGSEEDFTAVLGMLREAMPKLLERLQRD